jgi:PAS domain S-box-containing protein
MFPEPFLPTFAKYPAGERSSSGGPLFAAWAGGASAIAAVLVLLGWALDVDALKAVLPRAAAMRPFMAVGLFFLGLGLVSSAVLRPPFVPASTRVAFARLCACVPLIVGGAMLMQYFTGTSFGIDRLLFPDALLAEGSPHSGRISPAGSACLSLLGISLLLLDAQDSRLRRFSQWPALVAAGIAFVAVLGYLYGAQQLSQMKPYESVAVHTALVTVAIGAGLVLVRPGGSVLQEILSQHHGGLMARRVLPLAILLPMVMGWLRLQGQRAGLYDTETGLALFASSNIVVFAIVIWLAARTLNRVDADRRGSDFRRLYALREAETRWRALIEASAQIVWTAGPNGEPQDSPSMRAFTGQTPERWRAEGIQPVTHPDDRVRMANVWSQAVTTRTAIEAEFRLKHASGEWRWMSVRGVPVEPTAESCIGWVGMNRDVTDRKQSQALAEGQKHVLELIARGAPLPETLNVLTRLIESQAEDMYCSILLLDPDGKHVRHGAAPRLPEAYTKAIDGTAIGPNVGSCGTAAYTRRAVYVEDIATDPLWKDFKHLALPHGLRACWSTPIIDAGGRVLGTFAIYYLHPAMPSERHIRLIDLATHTAAICLSSHNQMQALRDSEGRFRQLAESLPQHVWTCEPDGRSDYFSQKRLDYTGTSAESQIGYGWMEWVHPADREPVKRAWQAAIARREDYHFEVRLRRHDGIYRWFDSRAVALRDTNGNVLKWIGSNTDIDDRKRFEESQLRSQKLESLGTLAGGIAHDFNNMLLVIQGNAQLAQELLQKDNAVQEHLVEIVHASERASDLVRRILSFSRPQKARHKVLNLGPAVDEALKFARATLPAMVEIRPKIATHVPSVAADATQIHQILLNLATNSAHAIGARGGIIEVELAGVDIDAEAVTCALDNVAQLPPGRYARLTVRDNGCGMSPEVVERIFDPFFTTKPVGQGTGLGLSIVHGIMRSAGGAVTVQSEPGKGTSFHLYFPAAADAAATEQTATHPALTRGSGQHVLFIDDEDAVVRLGTLNLTRLGYRVTGCTEPSAALKEFHRDPEAIDAVVTDLSMPGMSGFDCAREMLATRPDLPILLTSGYIRPEDEAEAREIGIRALCSKPAALNELGELLAEMTASARAGVRTSSARA